TFRRILLSSDEFAQLSWLDHSSNKALPGVDWPALRQEKLVFLHLPKTGGTTLHHHLAQLFDRQDICPERFNGLHKLPLGQLARYRFISGHYDLASCLAIPGAKKIITFLREPRARLVSLYNFLKAHRPEVARRNGWGLALMADELTIEQFFAHPEVRQHPYINNGMTRALANHLSMEVWPARDPEAECRDVSGLVEDALRLLEGLAGFGILERFDESVQLLTDMLGVPACAPGERRLAFENLAEDEANYRQVELSRAEEVSEAIFAPLIEADLRLYRGALELLERRLAERAPAQG
ncbi:MAG: sulfotransferase family 2 domain-containing protein, partial [Pseudomonas sp.]